MLGRFFGGRISARSFLQAARDNDLVTVQSYITENINNVAAINHADPRNLTFALIEASFLGHIEIINALLAVPGIDPNVMDPTGETPLTMAARRGHVAIIKALLSATRLKLALRNMYDNNAAQVAKNHGYNNIADLIISESKARIFRRAAQKGDLNKVQEYITAISDKLELINASDSKGLTALSLAAGQGHVAIVNALLSVPGIDGNIPDKRGFTAFSRAAYNGHLDCVIALLNVPVDGNSVDINGCTALFHAAFHGHMEVVKVLVAANSINLSIRNNYRMTAAHAAAENHHTEIVQIIEAAMAAPAVVRSLLDTPVSNIAVEDSLRDIPISSEQVLDPAQPITISREQFLDPASNVTISREQFLEAAREGDLATIEAYIAINRDDRRLLNISNGRKNSALHLAAISGHDAIINTLGALSCIFVNARNSFGATPLMLAGFHGHLSTVTALLGLPEIDVNVIDNDGETALFSAVRAKEEDLVDLFLKDSRVELMIQNRSGRTASQVAEFLGIHVLAQRIEAAIEARRVAASVSHQPIASPLVAAESAPVTISAEEILAAARNGYLPAVEAYQALVQRIEAAIEERGAPALVSDQPIASLPVTAEPAPVIISAEQFLHAAQSGDLATVQAYIAVHGNDSTAMNVANERETSDSALILATLFKRDAIITALGAVPTINTNATNALNTTPLIAAVLGNNPSTITAVLALPRLQVNAINQNGNTALIIAALGRRNEAINLLINDPNVDLTIANLEHLTAAQVARTKGYLVAAKSIEAAIAARRAARASIEQANLAPLSTASSNPARISAQQFLNAAAIGDITTVQNYTIVNGDNAAAMNVTDSSRNSALHLAAQSGHDSIITFLGAIPSVDVNAFNSFGMTPLLTAAMWGPPTNTVRNIMRLPRVDVNTTDHEGDTVLNVSARLGREHALTLLLDDSRVNPYIENNLHSNAIDTARRQGLHYIKERIEAAIAARRAATSPVARSIASPSAVPRPPAPTISAAQFLQAARSGDLVTLQAYITVHYANEAAMNVTENLQSALHLAALFNHPSVITALGAVPTMNVNAVDNARTTPLMVAAIGGAPATITAVLGLPRIAINATDRNGNTALILAALAGQNEATNLLIREASIDLGIINNHFLTADQAARSQGYVDLAKAIDAVIAERRAARARIEQVNLASSTITAEQFLNAAREGDLATVEAYIALNGHNPAAMNVSDNEQRTALHLATGRGHCSIINTLIAVLGVNVNAANKFGSTPLITGVMSGMADAVTALLTLPRIEVNATDSDGDTTLITAVILGLENLIILLISDHRVNFNIQNNRHETAADRARVSGHNNLAEMIDKARSERAAASASARAAANARGYAAWIENHRHELTHAVATVTSISPQRFLAAARDGDLPTVQSYIAAHRRDLAGAINVVHPANGNTALIMAAIAGRENIVNELLNTQGVNIEVHNRQGFNAAQEAQRNTHADIAIHLTQLISARAIQTAAPVPLPTPVSNDAVVVTELNFEQRLEAIRYDGIIPEHLKCPISHSIMNDPITVKGQTFDRGNLKIWAGEKATFHCPITNAVLKRSKLNTKTSISIRTLIENFVIEQEALHAKRVEEAKKQAALAAPQPPTTGLRLFDPSQKNESGISAQKEESSKPETPPPSP